MAAAQKWPRAVDGSAQGRRRGYRLGRALRRSVRSRLGLEVGYWFSPSAWGHGFASELVEASLVFAHGRGVMQVSAFARPENAASCRVLEKAGFRKERFVESLARNLYRRELGEPGGS